MAMKNRFGLPWPNPVTGSLVNRKPLKRHRVRPGWRQIAVTVLYAYGVPGCRQNGKIRLANRPGWWGHQDSNPIRLQSPTAESGSVRIDLQCDAGRMARFVWRIGPAGGGTRTRTWDQRLKRTLLYRLSYTPSGDLRRHDTEPRSNDKPADPVVPPQTPSAFMRSRRCPASRAAVVSENSDCTCASA